VTTEGAPFWSGPKKPPQPLVFDVEDKLHLGFVKSVANLRAANYGLMGRDDDAFFRAFLPNVMVPDFTPAEGVKIAVTEAESKEQTQDGAGAGNNALDVDQQCAAIIAALPPPSSLPGYKLVPIDFDKDIDSQMIVVEATSNLRARNYKIPEADLHRSR
jgi:ubiquitin-activating enzyme E1